MLLKTFYLRYKTSSLAATFIWSAGYKFRWKDFAVNKIRGYAGIRWNYSAGFAICQFLCFILSGFSKTINMTLARFVPICSPTMIVLETQIFALHKSEFPRSSFLRVVIQQVISGRSRASCSSISSIVDSTIS